MFRLFSKLFAGDSGVFIEGVEYYRINWKELTIGVRLINYNYQLKKKKHYIVSHRFRRKFRKINLTINRTKIAQLSVRIIIDSKLKWNLHT